MTGCAERNDVAEVEAERGMLRPRSNVVGVQAPRRRLDSTTANAPVGVACVDFAKNAVPSTRRIDALPLRSRAAGPPWIEWADAAAHSIPRAAKVWLGDAGLDVLRQTYTE